MQSIRCCLSVHYVMCSMHALIIGSVRWQAIHAPVSLTSATLGPGAHFLHVQAKALLFGILLHSSRTDYVPSSSTHFLFAHSFEKYTQRGFTLRVFKNALFTNITIAVSIRRYLQMFQWTWRIRIKLAIITSKCHCC